MEKKKEEGRIVACVFRVRMASMDWLDSGGVFVQLCLISLFRAWHGRRDFFSGPMHSVSTSGVCVCVRSKFSLLFSLSRSLAISFPLLPFLLLFLSSWRFFFFLSTYQNLFCSLGVAVHTNQASQSVCQSVKKYRWLFRQIGRGDRMDWMLECALVGTIFVWLICRYSEWLADMVHYCLNVSHGNSWRIFLPFFLWLWEMELDSHKQIM